MSPGTLAYHMIARHGYEIERLKRDMVAENSRDGLVDFLAYDAASFVYAFLIASGNQVSPFDRTIRDDLKHAITGVLTEHGITADTFVVSPELSFTRP